MPKRNRQSLKASFKQGNRPTELDFENLIDSTVNLLDDGLSKTPENGLALIPAAGQSAVLSVFRETGDECAAWELTVDPETGSLSIGQCREGETLPLVTLRPSGEVVVGDESGSLQLNGTVRAASRRGTFAEGEVPANGRWQDLTGELEGCWALEVVAGCGRKNTGKHSLVVATAVHCFGSRPRISKTDSHYGVHGHKIRLRWKKREGYTCVLQARTAFDYGKDIRIRYHIARLWDEPYMEII